MIYIPYGTLNYFYEKDDLVTLVVASLVFTEHCVDRLTLSDTTVALYIASMMNYCIHEAYCRCWVLSKIERRWDGNRSNKLIGMFDNSRLAMDSAIRMGAYGFEWGDCSYDDDNLDFEITPIYMNLLQDEIDLVSLVVSIDEVPI